MGRPPSVARAEIDIRVATMPTQHATVRGDPPIAARPRLARGRQARLSRVTSATLARLLRCHTAGLITATARKTTTLATMLTVLNQSTRKIPHHRGFGRVRIHASTNRR